MFWVGSGGRGGIGGGGGGNVGCDVIEEGNGGGEGAEGRSVCNEDDKELITVVSVDEDRGNGIGGCESRAESGRIPGSGFKAFVIFVCDDRENTSLIKFPDGVASLDEVDIVGVGDIVITVSSYGRTAS